MGIRGEQHRDVSLARQDCVEIGGEQCTRRCDFCQIDTGKPAELDRDERILRPLNYGEQGVPGRGWGVFHATNGTEVAVVNAQGRTYMAQIENPFTMTHSSLPASEKTKEGVDPHGIRLSIGLEEPEDIIADLDRALR